MSPLVVFILLIFAVAGLVVGSFKGRPVWGFFLGLILSFIGVIIIAAAKPKPEYLARKAAERQRAEEEGRALLDAERRQQP